MSPFLSLSHAATQRLSATIGTNCGLKSKCQVIPFRMFTIMFVGFVTQLSMNDITPTSSLRAQWHVDIQSEQKDWAGSVPAVIHRLCSHKHWPRFCRKTHKQTCSGERHLSCILHWFVITHQRQSLKNNYIGPRHTSVWTKSLYNNEHLWHSFLLMP